MRNRFSFLFLGALLCAITSTAQQKPHPHLPGFQFRLLDGTVVNSADLKGKVVVVEFWGTWCKPCLAEIPEFNVFYGRYKSKGVFLVALAVDSGSEETVRQSARRLAIQYPVSAPTLKELDAFGDIAAVPTTWIVDRAGNVHTVLQGSDSAKMRTIRENVDILLKERP